MGRRLESGAVMYEDFFNLRERPFLTAPDPQFLYWSERHKMAFTMLRYGIMTRAPLTVVTGEIGVGKTTLLRELIAETPDDLTVGLVSNMQAGRGELLHWVLMALDQPFSADEPYVLLFRRFQDFVVSAYASGKRVLLIFDEAQNMSVAELEELRMLSNINAEKDELLQIILVGQPELRELVRRPELTQFAQRVSADFHLEAMTEMETCGYIQRRLEVAGAEREIFPERTRRLIHAATGGVPRLINVLCDLCMVYAYSDNRQTIGEDLLREFLTSAEKRGIYSQFKSIDQPPRLVETDRPPVDGMNTRR